MNERTMCDISVIMPAYNEKENIAATIKDILDVSMCMDEKIEVIVINDGSTDGTAEEISPLNVKVVDHAENIGYGGSLKDGIRASSGQYVMIVDADGTYDIKKIPKMAKEIRNADLVIAKRMFGAGNKGDFKSLARKFFAYWTSYYTKKKIEDLNSGFRIFRRSDIADDLERYPDGFSFTSTMTVLFLSNKRNIRYIEAEYKHRKKGSKFVSGVHMKPIAKLLFSLTRMWCGPVFFSQMLFVLLSAVGISLGIGSIAGVGALGRMMIFVPVYICAMYCFLTYVYMRGKAVK